jgi:probable rRNA maturation factor
MADRSVSTSLFIKNQQRTHPINVRYLRWMTKDLLRDLLWIEDYDLGIYIVRAPKMAEINQTHLQHEGPTDVITFDYGDGQPKTSNPKPETQLHGELFICIDVAIAQAKEFRTTWQSELIRYVVHGVLHLHGYDDLKPELRKVMKREENRLVKKLAESFPPAKLGKTSLARKS